MENEIDLEKKIKELDNIVYKVGQFAQTVHMLTKPQAFYDNTHKQALGYQNPFYLRKAQRIKTTLYDGAVISKTHVAMPVIDDEETLILEEESRSKKFEKAKDPEVIAKKISHKPIDYEKLNSLIEDFETRFSPQQELSVEQAFWFKIYNNQLSSSKINVSSSSITGIATCVLDITAPSYKGNATSSRGNTTSGQERVFKCYNFQGEGYMARQCTQPKRPRNDAWYKEKAMLAEA
ncbi:hypothetical protein Tco_0166445, partial [Tanacetum coccineum]